MEKSGVISLDLLVANSNISSCNASAENLVKTGGNYEKAPNHQVGKLCAFRENNQTFAAVGKWEYWNKLRSLGCALCRQNIGFLQDYKKAFPQGALRKEVRLSYIRQKHPTKPCFVGALFGE